jgi:hypothetical protein
MLNFTHTFGRAGGSSIRGLGQFDGRKQTGLKGLSDEDVKAVAFLCEGNVEAGVDVFFREKKKAKSDATCGQELIPLEGVVIAKHLPCGQECAGAQAF